MDAVIYARYSSDNQREESIDAQVRAISAYAQREGYQITHVYSDEAKSATTDQRPQFLQLMRDAEHGLFKAVIVHKLDRFSRDRFDSAFYKRHLKKHGVRLISVLENLDGSPESIILESVLEGMAEYYSKNLSREVMKGMLETAYSCKHTGGIAPLGFDVMPDKSYAINPIEAESIRLIYDLFASGSGYGTIIRILNEKGFKTKLGRPFGTNSIHELLKNEKYIGTFTFNRTPKQVAGKRNSHRHKPEDEIIRIPNGIPAIISIDLWERVQSKMTANKKASGAYSAKTTYILSGLVFCGACGAAMSGKKAPHGRNKEVYGYYECGARKARRGCTMKSINKEFVEQLTLDTLYDSLFSDEAIESAVDAIMAYASNQGSEIPALIAAYEKDLSVVEVELTNIVNAIAKGAFHESVIAKMNELESTKASLKVRIEEASLQKNATSLTHDQVRSYLSRYRDIKNMSAVAQKEAVRQFVEKVTVYDDRIDLEILTTPRNSGHQSVKTENPPLHNSQSTGPDGAHCTLLVEATSHAPRCNGLPTAENPLKLRVSVSLEGYRHNSDKQKGR